MTVSVRTNSRRRVAAEDKQRRGVSLRQVVGLMALCTCVALFYAFTSVKALDISYQISRALEVQRALREEGRRLKVELNNLRAPRRLDQAGKAMGLAPAGPAQTRRLP